jgi:hypothetical protein
MNIYREFLGTETEVENKSLFVRFVERCKLVWSKINFEKVKTSKTIKQTNVETPKPVELPQLTGQKKP